MRAWIVGVVLVLIMAGVGRGAVLADGDGYATVELPTGWHAIPSDEIAKLPAGEEGLTFVSGARAEGGRFPYALMAVLPGTEGDPAGHMAELQAKMQKAGYSGVTVTYNAARRSVDMRIRMYAPNGAMIDGMAYMFIRPTRSVALYCYNGPGAGYASQQTFEGMANSVQLGTPFYLPGLSPHVSWYVVYGVTGVLGILLLKKLAGGSKAPAF